MSIRLSRAPLILLLRMPVDRVVSRSTGWPAAHGVATGQEAPGGGSSTSAVAQWVGQSLMLQRRLQHIDRMCQQGQGTVLSSRVARDADGFKFDHGGMPYVREPYGEQRIWQVSHGGDIHSNSPSKLPWHSPP